MTRKSFQRTALGLLTALPVLLVLGMGIRHLARRGKMLTVWSCGGNYESLKEYVRDFSKREHVRVRYTAAPVMYLLEEAMKNPQPPDVIVGRAGPGWIALRNAGLLLEGPEFFAIDPLVIAVAPGNPKHIEGIEDLGRPDIRVALASGAMRPKGKVPTLLMAGVSNVFYPGLVERWENNAVENLTCGRHLLEPIIAGQADAAIIPRSVLTYRQYAGKVEEVVIPARELLTMKKGGPSLPQCAGVLKVAAKRGRQEAAHRFVYGLRQQPEWLARNGYITLDEPRGKQLARFLQVAAPRDMPGWQAILAERLEASGNPQEALRRWLKVIYTFGPNHYTARALYESGRLALAAGRPAAAAWSWKTVIKDYPPVGPVEYDSPVLHAGGKQAPIEKQPYSHWIALARSGLADLAQQDVPGRNDPLDEDPVVRRLFPIHVTEGDPPKNGKRELGLGLHLMIVGDYDFATRDFLKVVTLKYPSRYMPEADYLLGVCAMRRGRPDVAVRQWQRVLKAYPQHAVAEDARRALARAGEATTAAPATVVLAMPPWKDSYDTHAHRAMTYGMRLFEHGLYLFCFKEMMKIQSGIYRTHDMAAQLRYRAGVACCNLGNLPAAASEWRICSRIGKGTEWAALAEKQLRSRCKDVPVPSAPRNPKAPAKGKGPKGGAGKRFKLAEEFRRAGVTEQGQVIMEYWKVLTVARPPETPRTRPFLAMAELRLAECMRQAGLEQQAEDRLRDVVEHFSGTPAAKKAAALLRPPSSPKGKGTGSSPAPTKRDPREK